MTPVVYYCGVCGHPTCACRWELRAAVEKMAEWYEELEQDDEDTPHYNLMCKSFAIELRKLLEARKEQP